MTADDRPPHYPIGSGQVGGAAARRLLAEGAAVRVLVRDPSGGAPWAARGAEVAVADLDDRSGLREALAGSDGAFVLLPVDPAWGDVDGQTTARVEAIAGAVADSEVPHVVALSSYGADLPAGTGPIVGLHRLEEALGAAGTTVTAVRSAHFQEKVSDVLEVARHERVYPVFAGSADVPRPMIATRDIGEVVARMLRHRPSANEVVALDGPTYTERQVADRLGRALGHELTVVTIPRAGWVDALVDAGLPLPLATVLAELHDADERELLGPRGDRLVRCTTELETTLERLVGVPV